MFELLRLEAIRQGYEFSKHDYDMLTGSSLFHLLSRNGQVNDRGIRTAIKLYFEHKES